MPVQVIIKRKLKIQKPEKLTPLLDELHSHAKKQPGYISGKTLRSIENPHKFLVISTWETADDWNTWVESKERRDIQGRVDSMIGERTFYEIYEDVI